MASIDEIIGWVKSQHIFSLTDDQRNEIEGAVLGGLLVAYAIDENTGTHAPATHREVSQGLGNSLGAIGPGRWVLICRNRNRNGKPDPE